MAVQSDITGLILAGGAGRRVGGRDKGLMLWQGKPLIEHVSERLTAQVGALIISCNRNRDRYQELAQTSVADGRESFQGPLAGIEAASPYLLSDLVLIVACDTPLLPADLAPRLTAPFDQATGKNLDVCYAHDGSRAQYLCAAIRRDCLPSLTPFLDEGHRAVKHWYEGLSTVSVDFSDQPGAFINFNELS